MEGHLEVRELSGVRVGLADSILVDALLGLKCGKVLVVRDLCWDDGSESGSEESEGGTEHE